MDKFVLRLAKESDALQLLSIYAPYIQNTAVSFETAVPAEAEFAKRISEITSFYPYLICEHGGSPVGYAYAHRHMERAAYRFNAELSIYLDGRYHRRGIGRALYCALVDILRLQHIKNAYGCIALPNFGSVGLHESMGFKLIGIYKNTGYKLGRWHDVAWYGLELSDYTTSPAEPVSIAEIPSCLISDILARWSDELSHP